MVKSNWLLRAALPAVLLSGAAFAACGGDDDDDVTTQVPSSATTAPAGSPASAPGTVPEGAPHVSQDNLKFEPNQLTVKAGEKVYFTNDETALHTVTINKKNESGNMKKGDVFVWTPPAAGTYDITCDYHPQMKAKITVQ